MTGSCGGSNDVIGVGEVERKGEAQIDFECT